MWVRAWTCLNSRKTNHHTTVCRGKHLGHDMPWTNTWIGAPDLWDKKNQKARFSLLNGSIEEPRWDTEQRRCWKREASHRSRKHSRNLCSQLSTASNTWSLNVAYDKAWMPCESVVLKKTYHQSCWDFGALATKDFYERITNDIGRHTTIVWD